MQRHFLRAGPVLAVAGVCAIVPLAVSRSQDEGSSDGGANKLHFPVDDDATGLFETAQRAVKEGDSERAVDLLRSAIDKDQDSRRPNRLLTIEEPGAAADAPRRFIGVTERAGQILRGFPKEVRETFRKKFDLRARTALEAALAGDDPIRDLIRVYDRYPVATCAVQALETAADRSFARGDLERARRLYERLLREQVDELKSPPQVREKMLLACIPLGRKADVERILAVIGAEDKDARIRVNGIARSRAEIIELTLKHDALVHFDAPESRPTLPEVRGDAGNRACFGRPIRIGPSRFRAKTFDDGLEIGDGRRWRSGGSEVEPPPARYLPVVWNDTIFVATPDHIRAFGLDGTEKPGIIPLGVQQYRDENPNVQFGSAIEHGVLMAPFVEKVQEPQQFRGIPIKVVIPVRKLGGFDVERWRWRWNHSTILAGTRLEHASFPVAPVCADGDCFVAAFAIEGFVNCYAVAYNADTGAVRWSTWIASGQVEQTMFGEHAREPLCVPCALGDGQVFDATQMGCVAAMDADTGRLRWVTEYDQIEVHSAKGYYPDPREIGWENNAPIYDSGVLVAAPMDSNFYYGFNATTGERLWRAARVTGFDPHSELRYLVGASDGKVVIAGGKKIRCCDVQTGKAIWSTNLERRLVAGRGVIAGGKVYIPTTDFTSSTNGTIEVVSLASGTPEGSQVVPLVGNVSPAGDAIVITSDSQLSAFQNQRTEKSASHGRDF
jgi:outer membrane protein assembly factor BamB